MVKEKLLAAEDAPVEVLDDEAFVLFLGLFQRLDQSLLLGGLGFSGESDEVKVVDDPLVAGALGEELVDAVTLRPPRSSSCRGRPRHPPRCGSRSSIS